MLLLTSNNCPAHEHYAQAYRLEAHRDGGYQPKIKQKSMTLPSSTDPW
jgi:hypothetical protein